MEEDLNVRISVPKADLPELTICSSNAAAIADWVAALPMANTAQVAAHLDQATTEVSRLQCSAAERFAMLEHLRPPLHYISTRLDRAALNNSNDSDSIAQAAQNLEATLTTGYKAVVRDALPQWSKRSGKSELPKAIHRALSDMSRVMLRTFQLYVTPPNQMWQELNQLYFLAEQLKLQDTKVEDTENHNDSSSRILDAYLRPVLLNLCKPNQLRYENLTRIFNALEQWTSRVSIEPTSGECLFSVDLAIDQGPIFSNMLKAPKQPRGISIDVLVYELEAYLKEIDSNVPVPDYLDEPLLSHLVSAWGSITQRSFRRLETTGSIAVAVGLRTAHYFISGGVEFGDQVRSSDTMLKREINPFGDRNIEIGYGKQSDVWERAQDVGSKIPINPNILDPERILYESKTQQAGLSDQKAEPKFRFYNTQAMDTSPGGYCVHWLDAIPNNLQTGELVAMRDASDPRWCVAVVRWIRQNQQGTTMGIELIAPRAIPVATRVIQKKGGPTDYARAFLLPELKPINQPATLITSRVPFASDQKIHIQRQGVQTTAQLGTRVLSTESFNQFTFRMLDGYLENAQINLNIQSLSELIGVQEPHDPK
jgi:hypothetical protein